MAEKKSFKCQVVAGMDDHLEFVSYGCNFVLVPTVVISQVLIIPGKLEI